MDIGMFTVLLEHKLLSGIFLALLSLSIICQIRSEERRVGK